MMSLDTNILLYAQNRDSNEYEAARGFVADCANRDDVAICELVLLELYQLLRNPAVLERPLGAQAAARICETYRQHPRWALIENAPVMRDVWRHAAQDGIARRRVFDARIALTLRYHGVTAFATRNTRDFTDFGFSRVWDPLRETGV